jgi:hypothetical protein
MERVEFLLTLGEYRVSPFQTTFEELIPRVGNVWPSLGQWGYLSDIKDVMS